MADGQHEVKRCSKCREEKDLEQFPRASRTKDGRGYYCRTCNSAVAKAWKRRNPERKLELNRRWAELNPEKDRESKRAWKRRNPSSCYDEYRKYWDRNPEKVRARKAIDTAVRRGKIEKPDLCSSCGAFWCRIEGHHHSYEREFWLDVTWLCQPCHAKHHDTESRKESPHG